MNTQPLDPIQRNEFGQIDYDYYLARARHERAETTLRLIQAAGGWFKARLKFKLPLPAVAKVHPCH